MSVDLHLLPFDCDLPQFSYSHTVLSCTTSYPLWEEVKALATTPVPANFTAYVSRDATYDDPHYGVTTVDPYGQSVRACLAGDLAALHAHPGVQQHATNRAIWAYLAALPPSTRVALFWH
jgi:hypothetical protein